MEQEKKFKRPAGHYSFANIYILKQKKWCLMHVLWQVVKVNQQTTITSIDQVRWIPLSLTHTSDAWRTMFPKTPPWKMQKLPRWLYSAWNICFEIHFFLPRPTNPPRLVQFFLVYNININIVWERSRIKKNVRSRVRSLLDVR